MHLYTQTFCMHQLSWHSTNHINSRASVVKHVTENEAKYVQNKSVVASLRCQSPLTILTGQILYMDAIKTPPPLPPLSGQSYCYKAPHLSHFFCPSPAPLAPLKKCLPLCFTNCCAGDSVYSRSCQIFLNVTRGLGFLTCVTWKLQFNLIGDPPGSRWL